MSEHTLFLARRRGREGFYKFVYLKWKTVGLDALPLRFLFLHISQSLSFYSLREINGLAPNSWTSWALSVKISFFSSDLQTARTNLIKKYLVHIPPQAKRHGIIKKWLQKGQAPFPNDALAAVVFDFHKNKHYNKKNFKDLNELSVMSWGKR